MGERETISFFRFQEEEEEEEGFFEPRPATDPTECESNATATSHCFLDFCGTSTGCSV